VKKLITLLGLALIPAALALPSLTIAVSCGGLVTGNGTEGSSGAGGSSGAQDSGGSAGDAGLPVASLCTLSPECGTSTAEGCVPNTCPNNAACILFLPKGYSDLRPTKCVVQSCMPTCGSNSNCGDGYECVSPNSAPWNAFSEILDDDQTELVCLPSSCGSP
jgi:hypothetical protein